MVDKNKMKKFCLCFGLMICLMVVAGICGLKVPIIGNIFENIWATDNSFAYEIKNNVVCIKGYEGKKQTVEIPEKIDGVSVRAIASGAFSENSSIKSVSIPNSINSIEDKAFSSCTSLVQINIPEGVSKINDETFFNCTNLKEVSLPSSLTSIGNNAFTSTAIQNINLPDTVSKIGVGAFSNCYSLKSIKLPGSLDNVSDDVFSGCSSLSSVTILGSVGSIGTKSFNKCTSLSSIDIPSSVSVINAYAFEGCSRLSAVVLGRGVSTIGSFAFSNCTKLGKVLFQGNGIDSIDGTAFNNIKEDGIIIVPQGKVETYSNAITKENDMKVLRFAEGSSLDSFVEYKSKVTDNNKGNTNEKNNENNDVKKSVKDKEENNEVNNQTRNDNDVEISDKTSKDTKKDVKNVVSNTSSSSDDSKKDDLSKDENHEKKYEVKFVNSDGTLIDIIKAKENEIINLLSEPKGKGIFVGWESSKNGKKILAMEGDEFTIVEDMTFKSVWVDLYMLSGASIKLSQPTGIRYSSRIDKDGYDKLKSVAQSVSLGTIITPTDYVSDKVSFSAKQLTEKNLGYLDIPVKLWFDEKDGYKEFTGVITNVREKNYTREFSARSYISITYWNNKECRFYSSYSKKNNSRSIAKVAKAALKDEASYTEPQIDILKKFLEIIGIK